MLHIPTSVGLLCRLNIDKLHCFICKKKSFVTIYKESSVNRWGRS